MAAKPGRGRRAAAAPTAAVPPVMRATALDAVADGGREQLAVAFDASCAMLRGFEAMRAIQQRTAQEAAARHEAAARQLRDAAASGDLMSIPLGLWQGDLQGASRYWQELAAAALEAQTEVMASALHLFNADTAMQGVSAVEALEAIPGLRAMWPVAFPLCAPPSRRVA
jgi:Phasin protein